MPISFDIEQLRRQYKCKHYFETGMWDPVQTDISSWKAVESDFETVHCIELRKDFVDKAEILFNDHIKDGKYFVYNDDSVNMYKYLNKHPFFNNEKTIFFLDAHVDNGNIHNFSKKCPLFEELSAISELDFKEHIILIDDMRIITNPFPWGETSYGNIDFLDAIKRQILNINSDYNFKTLDGHVQDDVLCAYI